MLNDFKKEDLGKRVLLSFDLSKVDEDFYDGKYGYFKIPYEAIEKYQFTKIIRIKPPKTRTIKLKDSPTRELSIFYIAKALGASSITISGYIVGITPTYVELKKQV